MIAALVIAVVIICGLLAASVINPGNNTSTTPNGSNYGIRVANFLNSRVDNVEFYWIYNSTFVNEDISEYYQETEQSAFVYGVKMTRGLEQVEIEVLFEPWSQNIVGTGSLSLDNWATLSGSFINNGIGQMSVTETSHEYWPHTWPVTFILEIYFDDNTFFLFGFSSSDGLVYLRNGTWTGGYRENGWPETVDSFGPSVWLNEGGHLTSPMVDLFTTITSNVPYP